MRHGAAEMAAFYAENARMEDPTLCEPCVGRQAIYDYYASMYASLEKPAFYPEQELLHYATQKNRIWFAWVFASGGIQSPRVKYHGVSIQTIDQGLIIHDRAFWNPNG